MQPPIQMQPMGEQGRTEQSNLQTEQTNVETTNSNNVTSTETDPAITGPPPPYSPSPPTMGRVAEPSVPMVMVPSVGTKPTVIVCRACRTEIVTRVEFRPSMRTHLMAAICCLLGFWCCICVPYCIETCNSVDHYCPSCGNYVGTFQN